ncbi:hypothetical protein TNCV_1008101 [Trichonephila clavipes]|nr:hypothetical protein TNCV_1008101 [Trichonephila clavipes]
MDHLIPYLGHMMSTTPEVSLISKIPHETNGRTSSTVVFYVHQLFYTKGLQLLEPTTQQRWLRVHDHQHLSTVFNLFANDQ